MTVTEHPLTPPTAYSGDSGYVILVLHWYSTGLALQIGRGEPSILLLQIGKW